MSHTGKPYTDARKAAALLGVPLHAVIHDIEAGWSQWRSLNGADVNGLWLVESWQLEEPHLSRHRRRLESTRGQT
jgi:hypothetical protein